MLGDAEIVPPPVVPTTRPPLKHDHVTKRVLTSLKMLKYLTRQGILCGTNEPPNEPPNDPHTNIFVIQKKWLKRK
jgi:hypothetical protein